MTRPNTPRVCFIGFGEAGQALASGLRDAGVQGLSAWDILFPVPAGEALRAAADRIGVRRGASAGDAVKDADLIVAAVTAASSLDAAQAAKPFLRRDQYYLDINSVSPARKQLTGKLIDEAGRYVDMAVMAPVHPARHQTPSLLSGPHAASVEPILLALDMKVSVAGPGSKMRSSRHCRRVTPGSIGPSSSSTTSNAWPTTASGGRTRWRKWPTHCTSLGSIPI